MEAAASEFTAHALHRRGSARARLARDDTETHPTRSSRAVAATAAADSILRPVPATAAPTRAATAATVGGSSIGGSGSVLGVHGPTETSSRGTRQGGLSRDASSGASNGAAVARPHRLFPSRVITLSVDFKHDLDMQFVCTPGGHTVKDVMVLLAPRRFGDEQDAHAWKVWAPPAPYVESHSDSEPEDDDVDKNLAMFNCRYNVGWLKKLAGWEPDDWWGFESKYPYGELSNHPSTEVRRAWRQVDRLGRLLRVWRGSHRRWTDVDMLGWEDELGPILDDAIAGSRVLKKAVHDAKRACYSSHPALDFGLDGDRQPKSDSPSTLLCNLNLAVGQKLEVLYDFGREKWCSLIVKSIDTDLDGTLAAMCPHVVPHISPPVPAGWAPVVVPAAVPRMDDLFPHLAALVMERKALLAFFPLAPAFSAVVVQWPPSGRQEIVLAANGRFPDAEELLITCNHAARWSTPPVRCDFETVRCAYPTYPDKRFRKCPDFCDFTKTNVRGHRLHVYHGGPRDKSEEDDSQSGSDSDDSVVVEPETEVMVRLTPEQMESERSRLHALGFNFAKLFPRCAKRCKGRAKHWIRFNATTGSLVLCSGNVRRSGFCPEESGVLAEAVIAPTSLHDVFCAAESLWPRARGETAPKRSRPRGRHGASAEPTPAAASAGAAAGSGAGAGAGAGARSR